MGKSIAETVASQLEGLRTTFAGAVSGLNAERVTLENESQAILKAADKLKLLLPAQAREAQRAADALLVAGKREKAQAKLQEQAAAERTPAEMEQRRRDIASRIEEIDSEKRAIARRVFQEWFPGFRAALVAEQQTLCTALDNAWDGIRDYAAETGTIGQPNSLITAGLRDDLWAREHGEERILFDKLREWFGGSQ